MIDLASLKSLKFGNEVFSQNGAVFERTVFFSGSSLYRSASIAIHPNGQLCVLSCIIGVEEYSHSQ